MGLIIFIIASGLTLDLRPDGRAELRPRRVHRARRLRRHQRDGRHGRLDGVATRCGATWWRCSAAMLVAMAAAGALGLAFERVIVRPVYGQHLKQILITMGGMIVGEELIKVIWGPQQIALPLPDDAARQLRHRRCIDREVPRAGRGHRADRLRAAAVRAEPHQGRPADPRRRAGPRDGRSARLPHPPPVRRRVRRRLARWPAWAA